MRFNFRQSLVFFTALMLAWSTQCASILDIFKRPSASNQTAAGSGDLANLSQEQLVSGLKEALSQGVKQAVTTLGKTNGFLTNLNVRIPIPESLQKVEKTLRTLRQEKLADEFVTTMNNAAELAVPEAATVLGDAVKQMSIADARSILVATNTTAATEYFRRTSQTNLYAAFLPIVKGATEKAGVTSAYKRMTDKAAGGFGNLGALGDSLLGKEIPDLDDYVTRKALDGLFFKIAEEEKQIRANPAARTSALLQKVFGVLGTPAGQTNRNPISPSPAPTN